MSYILLLIWHRLRPLGIFLRGRTQFCLNGSGAYCRLWFKGWHCNRKSSLTGLNQMIKYFYWSFLSLSVEGTQWTVNISVFLLWKIGPIDSFDCSHHVFHCKINDKAKYIMKTENPCHCSYVTSNGVQIFRFCEICYLAQGVLFKATKPGKSGTSAPSNRMLFHCHMHLH